MSINSSSSLNATVDRPFYLICTESTGSSAIYIMYSFANLLFLVPLYILILYMGFQQWRRQQTGSHSDFFTYHMVSMEIFGVLGSLIYCLGIFILSVTTIQLGMYVYSVIFPGQTVFHLLTCVERYLAVVHPVTYIRLRETGGVRIRNISILCSWLLCFAWIGITKLYLPDFPAIPLIYMLSVSVVLTSFCCFSVLRVLTHPGPGEGGRDKDRVDQSKQRAFHIIVAIMGALLLRFVGLMLSFGFSTTALMSIEDLCALLDAGICLSVPSSLVLPLLFLHKTGKLACCRQKTETDQNIS